MLLATRIFLTAMFALAAYFLLHKIWTEQVDLLQWFRKAGDAIPVSPPAAAPKDEGILQPNEHIVYSANLPRPPVMQIGAHGPRFAGEQLASFQRLAKENALTIVMENDQIKVSLLVRDRSGRIVAEILKNEWQTSPVHSWDRNYDANSLEVRDESGNVVLQIRLLSGTIQCQAKLYDSTGVGFGFSETYVNRGGWSWYGVIQTTSPANPQLTNLIEPIFKYPSALHLGELLPAPNPPMQPTGSAGG